MGKWLPVVCLLLASASACTSPDREPIPDCTTGVEDRRCVLCVDAAGNAEWYFTGTVSGEPWVGCPSGTVHIVRPYGR